MNSRRSIPLQTVFATDHSTIVASRNLTEEQAFRNLSESLAKQSPFRPMVDSMSSLRASFSYNPPSTMDSNGPDGSSFPSYLPASNTPPIDLTGAIPSLHTQTHDLHLVGSSSFLGDKNTAFTPSEPVSRSVGDVLRFLPIRFIFSLRSVVANLPRE